MSTSPVTEVSEAPHARTPVGSRQLPLLEADPPRPSLGLSKADAENYAEWFALLADPTRVRLLHALSTSPAGAMPVSYTHLTLPTIYSV